MKKFFANPTVALLLAVIVVIASTLINTNVKLGRISGEVRDGFTRGVGNESAISSELKSLCNAADKLMILAKQNDIADADELSGEIDSLRSLLGQPSAKPHSMYALYEEILRGCFGLESALGRMSLSESDAESLSAAQHEAAVAKAAIDGSSYNSTVADFQKRYQHFPTVQLAKLAGVELPEQFA